MKKTALAAAILSLATGAAFAQSSLQIYGIVDASVEYVKAKDGVTKVSSDNLASSRLGFKGTEDLGSGLKGNFMLETGIAVDTGAQKDSTRFFDRAAWLGLSGGFGEVKIGRMDSLLGGMAGNSSVLGNQAYDDLKIAGMVGSADWRRIDNAITYVTPEFVPGLKLAAQYSLAAGRYNQETADSDTDQQFGLSATYTSGPFAVGVSHLQGDENKAGTQEEAGTLGYASYDFGMLKLIGYYQADRDRENSTEITDTAFGPENRTLTGIRVNVPVTPAMLVTASFAQVKNVAFIDGQDAKIFALKGIYSLSKRTAAYGMYTLVNNSDTAKLVVSGTGVNGKDASGLAFGVRHAF